MNTNNQPSCKSLCCLFKTKKCEDGSDITLSAYCGIIDDFKDRGEKLSNNQIEKEYRSDLQHAVNNCAKINSLESRQTLYFKFNYSEGGVSYNVQVCEMCKLKMFRNNSKYPRKSTYYDWKKDAKAVKVTSEGKVILNNIITRLDKKSHSNTFNTAEDVRKYFKAHGRELVSDDAACLMCLPEGDKYREGYIWMKKFFLNECQYPPNRGNICELPAALYSKESIHRLYEKEMQFRRTSADHPYCSLKEFGSIWKKCFPHVHIKKYLSVSGKCLLCSYFNEQMLLCQCIKDFEELQVYKEQHRMHIKSEKLVYYLNRRLAEDHPGIYLSLIIDGMQQSHSKIPYLGNQKEFGAEAVQQHIQGAKQHGFAKTFYRTFPHVKNGGNLAMTCLLDEIISRAKYCRKHNLDFPSILLLQVDGGPENTSKAFFAFLELLLRLNIFDEIYVNRLPVGHTHEDIDALFGVLWNHLKFQPVYTPQHYEILLLEAFKNGATLDTRKTESKKKTKA
jgi:hypothetical protein